MTLRVEEIWGVDDLQKQVGVPIAGAWSPETLREGVPPTLAHLIQYAAIWGISDDGYRQALIAGASEIARWNLQWVIQRHENLLDDWLAGPEAKADVFTDAYVAFSCMRLASDEIPVAKPGSRLH